MEPIPFSWLRVIGLVVLVGLPTFGGYQFGQAQKQDEWNADKVSRQESQDAALKAAAKAIAKIEVKSAKYIQPVQTEIRTNTVYRDCQHSADSLRNINALITGDELAGDGGLSASQPAR